MPNIESAAKRMRQAYKARLRNRSVKTAIHTARQRFLAAVEAKDQGTGLTLFRSYCSTLDKAAKKGIIKRNAANRGKQRAARRLAAIPA
jgi:small subunit ribosomal protein S20